MNIRLEDYHPYSDGIHNDANYINKAIHDCYKSGGGNVYISGIHKCGSIEILDNVYIYLEKDSKIILSDNLDDFYDINDSRDSTLSRPSYENCEYNGRPSKYFIYAFGRKKCGIKGQGVINGNQEIFYGSINKWYIEGAFYPRIPLIFFENCEDITFEEIILERSAFWTLHLVGCNKVLVDNITINNDLRMVNSDGIDPDHCQNVVIKKCKITSADDCIVFKTTEAFKKYGECKNIKVYNCDLTSTSAAIKFGTETVSNISNVSISDCRITRSNRGISFMLRDEGNISNIHFDNIHIETRRFTPIYWWGKAEAVAITALKRSKEKLVGKISNITFFNITGICENGILIYGEDNLNISDIKFDNISIDIINKTSWEKKGIDLRPSDYGILDGNIAVLHSYNNKDVIFKNFKYNLDDMIRNYIKDDIILINSNVRIND